MLKARNISKKFGNTYAVKNISFDLEKGDVTGLLGPNGAGKTTTMRMLTSYYFPTEGNISINDQNTVDKTLQTQKLIGYLPENNPLYLDMLTVDYLKMSAELNGLESKKITSQIKKTAKSVGIEGKLMTPLNELSKGYKQRVGIAAAILHDPKIIILDEPTEGLDPNQREEIRKLIRKLSENKTIIISTHVMQEVKAMCNKVIVINEGEIVAKGEPDKLSDHKVLLLKIEGENIERELGKIVTREDESFNIKNKKSKIKTVEISTHRELRPEVSDLVAKNKWIIWNMEMQDSLEEVFHSLAETH